MRPRIPHGPWQRDGRETLSQLCHLLLDQDLPDRAVCSMSLVAIVYRVRALMDLRDIIRIDSRSLAISCLAAGFASSLDEHVLVLVS